MGIHIVVEPNVKVYVEDINPAGNKTILSFFDYCSPLTEIAVF